MREEDFVRTPNLVDLNTRTPTPARIYDYLLGGKDNYTVDREAAENLITANPHVCRLARENRAFMNRAVRVLAEAGIRQLIDIGTGIPTEPAPHTILRNHGDPAAPVVYIDNDPHVCTHNRALLAPNGPDIRVIQADLLHPESILAAPDLGIIDLTRPVALLLVAVLHFVPRDRIHDIMDTLTSILAPGSYLVASIGTRDELTDKETDEVEQTWNNTPGGRATMHTRTDIEHVFEDFELLPPGIVQPAQWNAAGPRAHGLHALAGVGRWNP